MGKGLLDQMLEESGRAIEPEGRPRGAGLEPERKEEPARVPPWPQNVEQVLDLSDGELRVLLGEVAPNDLLGVVAEGSRALRNRILGQLDPESVDWMKGNLQLWDPATEALKQSSREALLKVARELVYEKRIAPPASSESEGLQQDQARDESQDELASALGQIVQIAHGGGGEALKQMLAQADHPLLHFGLSCLIEGKEGVSLERALSDRQSALEAAYRAELEMIRQAILAIERGEKPETYLNRLQAAGLVNR